MEKVGLLLLLVTIAAIQVCGTSAQSGDSNDTSEASGSGIRELPTPPSCHIPANSNVDLISANLTEEERKELLLEGRCYLACTIERFMPNNEATRKYNATIPYWPYMSVDKSCPIAQNVHECTRGCVLRSKLPNLTGRTCGQISSGGRRDGGICRVNCESECGGGISCANPDPHDPWIHPWCGLSCHSPSCQNGCNTQLSVITKNGSLPKDPIATPPFITPVHDRAGQFNINLSPASPRPRRVRGQPSFNSSSIAPVAFLLKIELMETQTFSFMWAAEPFTQLDLVDYACQEVQVSFAVTNRHGLSQFSEAVQIMVHGASIPHPPRNLQVSSEIDRRIGFFGHIIFNISWEAPHNDYFLDYYSVAISSVACRTHTHEWSDTFNSDDTFITLMATNTTKNTFPLTDCIYNIQVSSVGQAGSSNPVPETYHTPEFDPKNVGFQCERLWDSQKYFFSFKFTWTLPDFLRNGNIIDRFRISYLMKEESGESMMVGVRPNITLPQNSLMDFSKILTPNDTSTDGRPYNTPQHSDSMRVFLFEMKVIWKRNKVEHLPAEHVYNCTASTLSPAPTNVENITVDSYCFSNDHSQVTLSFSWISPANFNGKPANYTVCVGTDTLKPTESVIPDGHFCTSDSLLPELTNTTVTLLHVKISPYLYFQMRANNEFVSGNWSEAYQIPLLPMGAGCDLDTSTDSISSINVGIIVGSMLGGMLLIILLICCMCVGVWYVKMLRRRKKLRRITEGFSDPMYNRGPKTLYLRNPTDVSLKSPLDEWEIPASEVIMEKPLGEGAFGEVYKGVVKCPIVNPKVRPLVENALCTSVAIKLLKLSAKGNERKDFLSEIEMMKKVAEGQNPHVVGLLGCVTIQEPLCLITEFVKFGDLLSYLRMNRRMCTETSTEEDDENDAYLELGNVSPVDLISFAYQIASGMEYLSSLGIVHRDLACRNILVDEGKVLKITDFGMSRETDEIYVQKRTGRVPLKWMAIESIIAREFTSASDVWSFGITLWEIGTLGGFPYPSIQNEDLLSLLKGGYRMEKPDNCSPEVYDIMLMCWNEQPQKRPKFTELRSKFDAMLLAEGKDAYIDLRIDNDKPYYQLDTAATVAANGVRLSPNPNRRSFVPSTISVINSRSGSKECSPNPLHTPNFSPSHKSQASCCSSAHASPRKSDFGGGGLALSTSSFGRQSSNHSVRERTQTIASSGERRGEHAHENGRPLSLLLPRDRERERTERQNPYVDEPSRVVQASMLAPPNDDIDGNNRAAARRGSDGAIEMNHLRSDRSQLSQGAGIEIKITSEIN